MGTVRPEQVGVFGVGYQGRDIGLFVAELVERGVTRVVDVRLTPISRKPGFSKSALRTALDAVGIGYEHRRELGNPKDNRPGFALTDAEVAAAKARYAALLDTDTAQASLDEVAGLATRERVAVLCFEADQQRCHRDVVLREVAARLSGG